MKKWEQFELGCTEYLNKEYGNYFKHLGFSDSTVNDIEFNKGRKKFFIEAKMPQAQSGQFVALADLKKRNIDYSPRNKSEINEYSNIILEHMNDNFEKYFDPGTKGTLIEINPDIISSWITNFYKKKGVEFFISKGKEYVIFPIDQYSKYFDIEATYRVKKSGSRNLAKCRYKEVIDELNKLKIEYELLNNGHIKSYNDLNNLVVSVNGFDHMLRKLEGNIYRIRTLSNTYSTTVIFKISLSKTQDKNDLNYFENRIK